MGLQTYTTAGTHTFTVPEGVTSLDTVEVWGGGGGGSNGSGGEGGGGAGGGAYATITSHAVTPSEEIAVVVGAAGTPSGTGVAGGDSYFRDTSTVMAKGGAGGEVGVGGVGGQAAASVGSTKHSGGDGADTNEEAGGGGGSSAGTSSDGDNGDVSGSGLGGAGGTAPAGGGDGGDGGDDPGAGANGTAPGGGGGGGSAGSGATDGGTGGVGKVVITWTEGAEPTPVSETLTCSHEAVGRIPVVLAISLESAATVKHADIIAHECLASMMADNDHRYEHGIQATLTAGSPHEALGRVWSAPAVIHEARGVVVTSLGSSYESLLVYPVSQTDSTGFESLLGLHVGEQVQHEAKGAVVVLGVQAFESLKSASLTQQSAMESLLGVRADLQIPHDAIGFVIVQQQTSYERIWIRASALQASYESGKSTSQSQATSIESLLGLAASQQVRWESLLQAVASARVRYEQGQASSATSADEVAWEAMIGLFTTLQVSHESLSAPAGSQQGHLESAGLVDAIAVAAIENLVGKATAMLTAIESQQTAKQTQTASHESRAYERSVAAREVYRPVQRQDEDTVQ